MAEWDPSLFCLAEWAPGTPPKSWRGWNAHCLLNSSGASIFLGLPPGLGGREEYLQEPCCPLGFALVPCILGNEPSWPLATFDGASVQELRVGGGAGEQTSPDPQL